MEPNNNTPSNPFMRLLLWTKVSIAAWLRPDKVRKLMLFFLLVYVAEGMSMDSGVINQPIAFFLKQALGWNADKVTAYQTVLVIPWIVKPLYGLLSDFIPLFGYRRKSYLFLANAMCTLGYLWMMGLTAPSEIIVAFLLGTIGMAATSALCQAVMVESGKETGLSGHFVGQQWLWFSVASIVAALLGGWLCQHFASNPTAAFHYAALTAAIVPIGALLASLFLISEPKEPASIEKLKASTRGLWNALKSRTLWLVALFLALFFFSPGNGQPMYYYMTDTLKFSQEFIGILGAVSGVGAVIGSLLYMFYLRHSRTPRAMSWLLRSLGLVWLNYKVGTLFAALAKKIGWSAGEAFFQEFAGELERMNLTKALVYLSVVLGVISQAAFVFMIGPQSAIVLNVVTSIATQITLVTMLTLAAQACPDDAEGFSYAAILSVSNLGQQMGANFGAHLYVHWFHNQLAPLVLLSGAFTALCFFVVPFLPKESLESAGEDDADKKK